MDTKGKTTSADKSKTVTDAARGTGSDVTQQLVVILPAMLNPVTQVGRMHAHTGRAAAVVTGAREFGTVVFVLVSRTVVDVVAQHKDRQAVAAAGTLEMGVWAWPARSCRVCI